MTKRAAIGTLIMALLAAPNTWGDDYGLPSSAPMHAMHPPTRSVHPAAAARALRQARVLPRSMPVHAPHAHTAHTAQAASARHTRPHGRMIRPVSAAEPVPGGGPLRQVPAEPGPVVEPETLVDSSLACETGTCGGENCTHCGGDVLIDTFADPWAATAVDPWTQGIVDPWLSGSGVWSAGVEFTLLKPHFESNTALTVMDSDGVSFETFSDSQFNYDTELAPRVWLERDGGGDLGFRVVYWQFDHESTALSANPPANGFGQISHPTFGEIDLSTSVPNSQYTATSDLNAYSIDFDLTKTMSRGLWQFTTSGGLRFAEVEQSYRSRLISAQGQTQGTINFAHRVQGVGPTIAVRTQRPFSRRLSLFAIGRGSLLFGDGESSLNAIEDQDLANSFTTTRTSERSDVLPVGEVQVGFEILPWAYGAWQPYIHVAMEGQLWSGAGNASSETGDLGFYGLNVSLGFGR